MPSRRSESVELLTLTVERIDEMVDAQYDIKRRIQGQLTDNQLSTSLGGLASVVGLFVMGFGNPIPGMIATIVGGTTAITGLGTSDKAAVLQSIENGLEGLNSARRAILADPSRNYIRAYVGFLNYDNLGMRTVSSKIFGIL